MDLFSKFFHSLTNRLGDKSLTKKASLNTLASGSDYIAQLIVGFITTSLMVTGLGDYFYGVWQVMNRLFSYVRTTSSATGPLTWILAQNQKSNDFIQKQAYLGSSILVWTFFLPIIGIAGGVITWFAPSWLNSPSQSVEVIRIVAGMFIVMEALTAITYMPQAILKGENQGYRRLGLSILLIFLNGGVIWLALFLKTGIIGVTIAAFVQMFINGIFYLSVCRKYVPWFGIRKPSKILIKQFTKLSLWFFASDKILTLTAASDVVVLGLLNSVVSVTPYTLTKYIPETIISIVAITVVSILPGMGGIIGAGDLKRASQIRGELFLLVWLVITVMGTTTILWNNSFLTLWVGSNQFAGSLPNLLIVLVVVQFVLIRTDGAIIDLTLKIEKKVIIGSISAIISIASACIMVGLFKLGYIGVSIGLILGRLILSIAYPLIVNRYLQVSLILQFKRVLRPVVFTLLVFFLAFFTSQKFVDFIPSGPLGWFILILGSGFSALFFLIISFFSGLTHFQREVILNRFKEMLSK